MRNIAPKADREVWLRSRGAGVPVGSASWWFRTPAPMEILRDPVQGEFFNEESIVGTERTLVREAIQNALDAGVGPGPVTVRMHIGTLAASAAARYFEGLSRHLAVIDGAPRGILEGGACRFLVIEDFGTSGLTGDIDQHATAAGPRSNYMGFILSEGASSKSGGDRGRWGLGKYVFPKVSRILTFFALSVQAGDPHGFGRFVIGRSILRHHAIDGTSYAPDGFWAAERDQWRVPFRAPDEVAGFASTWSVGRAVDEPGLSVIIPFVVEDLTAEGLLTAVVKEYFVAIERGQLRVRVSNDGVAWDVDAGSLDRIIDGLDETQVAGVRSSLALLRWYRGLDDASEEVLPVPEGPDVDGLVDDAMRERVAGALAVPGGRVAVRVPIRVRPRANGGPGDIRESFFIVLLESAPGTPSERMYCRGGLLIPNVTGASHNGVRSLLLAEDGPVVQFLGDAEDPGHSTWREQGEHFRGRYDKGATLLRFIRNFSGNFVRVVRRTDEQQIDDYFAQWLSAPKKGDGGTPAEGTDEGDGQQIIDPPPPGAHLGWIVSRRADGSVHLGRTDEPVAAAVTVRLAYDVDAGDAFGRYQKFDFSLMASESAPEIRLVFTGAPEAVEVVDHNAFAILDPASIDQVVIVGFDRNRDVKIELGRAVGR